MANFDLHYADLNITGEVVGELNKVMFAAITAPERLGALFNVQKGITNGDKVFLVNDLGLQGKEIEGCSPDWDTANFTTTKTWVVGDYAINLKSCWADIPAIFKRYLKNGDGADAIRNPYLDEIVRPRLETALEKMYVRLGWFGSATSQASKLVTAGNSVYFNTNFEGIFPAAVAYTSTHPAQLVSIAANAQATWAAQKSAMLASGVATGVMDNVIMAASPALRTATDGVIFVTLAMADAVEADIRKNNKGSELQWQSIANGVRMAKYNGIDVVAVPQFDEVLANFKEADRNPYRVLYTTKANIQLGMHGNENLASVRVDYDAYHQLNLFSALDHFGALIAQDDLFVLGI